MNQISRSLGLRFLIVIIPMMVLLVGGSFFGFNLIVTNITKALSERFAKQQVYYDRSRTLQPLLQEIALARVLARSGAIIDWAEHEDNPQARMRGLAELENFRQTFKDGSYFFAINKSGNYYFNDADNTYAGRQLRYSLSPSQEKDAWYYATIKNPTECQLNVNLDNELGTTKIWINCLVKQGSSVVGVIGTGLELTKFIRLVLASYQEGVMNMFIDGEGAIQAHPDIENVDLHTLTKDPNTKKTVYRLLTDDDSREQLKQLLLRLKSAPDEVGTTYLTINGDKALVGAAYLKEIDWFNLTIITPRIWMLGSSFVPLAGLMVLGMLLTIALSVMLIHRFILSRIHRLEGAVEEIKGGHYSLNLPTDTPDEIGRLTASFKEMASIVQQNQQDLCRARDMAEAADLAKSAFLANMSHELRTPLHQIAGLAKMVRREPLTPNQAERIGMLESAVRRMTGLVESILELTKIEANKLELEEKPVAINSLLGNVNALLCDRAAAKGLQIMLEADALPTELVGDPHHIQLALMHYADNAVRFTESGYIQIRVKLQDDNTASMLLRFEVEDTGIGIAPDVLPRLFNIFEQADNSSTRNYGGAGVGLVMTRKLAQLMGGDAGCESTLGKGSTFWFTVRLKKSAPSRQR